MIVKMLIAGIVAGLIVIVFITTLTTPNSVGPIGILALFAAGYVILIGLMTFLLYILSRVGIYLFRTTGMRQSVQPLQLHKSYYYSTVLALAPIMLIGMQSVGGIGLYEFGLVILFIVIGISYISRKMT